MSQSVEAFRRELSANLKGFAAAGLEQEALIALAEELQYRLSVDAPKRRIPSSQSLEVLMRAVAAVLQNDPNHGRYIAGKLRHAVLNLSMELRERMPGFAQATSRDPISV
jgi:hypothetical protein